MSELLHAVIVVLSLAVAAACFFGAGFWFALFLYFYKWRSTLKEPGEQA